MGTLNVQSLSSTCLHINIIYYRPKMDIDEKCIEKMGYM